jgi:hypothetical protein
MPDARAPVPRRLVCTSCGHVWPADLLALRDSERCLICAGDLVDEEQVARPYADDEPSSI